MSTTTTPAPAAAKRRSRTPVPAPQVTPASVDVLSAPTAVVVQVPVDLLDDHPLNPRRDVGDITELADSIRVHGIRQNLLITPNPDAPDRYWLVIGHRRAVAARLCGHDTVPAVIDNALTIAAALELMLLENLQRTDLTPVEEADGYQVLLDLGLDVTAIAKRTGRSRSTVESRLALWGLPEEARELVHTYQATLGDAMRLADLTAR
ncbi:MAG TPA: ParB/RepB/Spo0J family partition protein, partial [Pengzhenrongella sp.]